MDEATAAAAAAFKAAHPEGGRALLGKLREANPYIDALAVAAAEIVKVDKPRRQAVLRVNDADDSREAWMLRAIAALTPSFVEAGVTLPLVRVSVGWPGGRGAKKGVVGQCWMAASVIDGRPAIFVSPKQREPVQILETILHELVHASGVHGHRSAFASLGAKVGLSAPWPSTPSSAELTERLHALAATLGPLDHSAIQSTDTRGTVDGPPVQSTRMLKLVCPTCGYMVRTTRKWIEQGLPYCGHGAEFDGDALDQMQEDES